jgi:hypothetical protein
VGAMDKLYETLYLLFSTELVNLNIGYPLNRNKLNKMIDIIGAIEYIKNIDSNQEDIINIINYYNK